MPELKRTSLVIFFLIAALAIPTYQSGNAAVEVLCSGTSQCPPGVSLATIRAHEDAALWGFAFMELTGFIAWIALWQFRLLSRVPRWGVPAVLLLSILTFAVMARAANLGGEIRHPEMAMLTRTSILIGVDVAEDGVPAEFKIISLLLVASMEPMSSQAA